jgi:hypothetical protein
LAQSNPAPEVHAMKILMVYPEFPDTFWSFKHALRFIRKKAFAPPLGLLTVAAMLPAAWEKRLVDLNVTRLTQQDLDWADYVFVSAMIVQREAARAVIAQCKQAGIQVVAGGPLDCGFCNITALLGHRPRIKTAAQIIAELDSLYALGWCGSAFFNACTIGSSGCGHCSTDPGSFPRPSNWRSMGITFAGCANYMADQVPLDQASQKGKSNENHIWSNLYPAPL